tara:strand:- start:2141 stop:2278 length:138 start_codon:yes stop_codon:yes gene_type:complete
VKLDLKNLIIGIVLGVAVTLIIGAFLKDVYIDIRIGNEIDQINDK